jgi:ATP phosphoribosyltransferase regulatory subunit
MQLERPLAAEQLDAIRAPFEAFGGVWTDTPVLQPLSLLLDLAGEAMRARLFTVSGEGAGELCLRFDFTVPIAAAHIASGAAEGRYLYQGTAFRTAPRDQPRPVEFLQIGAEVYGPADDPVRQDVEIAALAWAASEAGGRGDLGLVLGDVSLFDAFLTALDVPSAIRLRLVRAYAGGRGLHAELRRAADGGGHPSGGGRLAELLAGLPEGEAAGVLEEVWRLAGIQPVGGRSPAEIAHRLCARSQAASAARLSAAEADLIARYLDIVAPPREAYDRIETLAYEAKVEFDVQLRPWVDRLKGLVEAGVPELAMIFSTGFIRPFGYYDGMLFEVRSLELGYDRPVAAGGRYDGLPARLDPQGRRGAIGCMVRPRRAVAEA